MTRWRSPARRAPGTRVRSGDGPRWASVALSALALGCGLSDLAAPDPDPPPASMQRAFAALQSLLPEAFYESGWAAPERQAPIRRALGELTSAASALERHGREGGSATFRFLSRSLGDEARAIQREFGRRRYTDASYHTERLAETCIACHLRLPDRAGADLSGTLLAGIDRSRLSPIARANLETAGREFDAALDSYEEIFADPSQVSPETFSGAIGDYLVVALRARQDARRAEQGLAILAENTGLSAQLEFNLLTWRAALRELAPDLTGTPSLERAREILARGRSLTEFPLDAADQVHSVVASSLVFRWIEQERPEGDALARALYLLAQTEAFTRRAFERSEVADYLERAIRAAPRSEAAELAFARLESETVLTYALAGEEGIAPRERERLAELRALLRAEPEL